MSLPIRSSISRPPASDSVLPAPITSSPSTSGASKMLISGGTVVTGDGITVIPDGNVLIRNGRIADVGPGPGPQEDEIVDASGQVVLPGVINTHAHGCVRGPFVPVASAALSETEVRTQLDRHLHGGE